jgi:hypothetical protein
VSADGVVPLEVRGALRPLGVHGGWLHGIFFFIVISTFKGPWPESQGRNLALTLFAVPSSLDRGLSCGNPNGALRPLGVHGGWLHGNFFSVSSFLLSDPELSNTQSLGFLNTKYLLLLFVY